MRNVVCCGLLALSSFLAYVLEASSPAVVGVGDDVQLLVDEEVWRAGGPRPERLVELMRHAIAGGDADVVGALERALVPLFKRRWVDPHAFAPFLPQIQTVARASRSSSAGDIVGILRYELKLSDLTLRDQQDLYRSLIESGGSSDEYGLSWESAAFRALVEHADDLVPVIEQALTSRKRSLGSGRPGHDPLQAQLALARCRRGGDWVGCYMTLVREQVAAQSEALDFDLDSERNLVVRDALLELVHEGHKELLPDLKRLWRSIRDPEQEAVLAEHRRRGVPRAPHLDAEYLRPGLKAYYLLRAIWGLGDRKFQAKNTRHAENLEFLEKHLYKSGVLKRDVAPEQ